MSHRFLSPRDIKDRAQLEAIARPINSHDLLKLELRLELLILARLDQIEHNIMATQKEVADRLQTVDQALASLGIEVTKVGSETASLVKEVADLKAAIAAGGDASPEVTAALSAVEARVSSLQTAVQTVDDLVPDAAETTTTTPAPEESTTTTPNPTTEAGAPS